MGQAACRLLELRSPTIPENTSVEVLASAEKLFQVELVSLKRT